MRRARLGQGKLVIDAEPSGSFSGLSMFYFSEVGKREVAGVSV
jgi:hypothetical protein